MQDVVDSGAGHGCIALFVWAAVARGAYIPIALLMPQGGRTPTEMMFLCAGLSLVASTLLVPVPLRLYFRRRRARRHLADAARAYQRRQDGSFS
ncbi:hypothetical protein ACIBI4_08650 [Streptomyces sp. NPDC050418]|uniref:hypothetical protein n=1 Tax=Streptomyces sp. NPDC050418 TaxID=3365612 RepID=UPI0037AD5FBE